jgi:hypothetical protein
VQMKVARGYDTLTKVENDPRDLFRLKTTYVSVSRASHDAQIYANGLTSLTGRLSRDATKASTINFGSSLG